MWIIKASKIVISDRVNNEMIKRQFKNPLRNAYNLHNKFKTLWCVTIKGD